MNKDNKIEIRATLPEKEKQDILKYWEAKRANRMTELQRDIEYIKSLKK